MIENETKAPAKKNIIQKMIDGIKGEKTLTAQEAYLFATYGAVETKEERLKIFYDDLNALIYNKSQSKQYCCAIEIPDELDAEFEDTIKSKYEKLGFTVVDLNKAVEKIQKNYLFICWDNKF